MDLVTAGIAGLGVGVGLCIGVVAARLLARYLDDDRKR
jgi:uncharacterized membrane-anchored protein YhcB (DUF1043 family)